MGILTLFMGALSATIRVFWSCGVLVSSMPSMDPASQSRIRRANMVQGYCRVPDGDVEYAIVED